MEIRMEKCKELKQKPDQKHLGFGKYMTDYMFVMDWTKDEGWKDARIVPYAPITLEPACVTLHYAQETFEGMKAYRTAEGKIQLFRPEMNAKRMINSNARLCMPEVPEDMFVEAVKALVKVEEDWGTVRAGNFFIYQTIYVCNRKCSWSAYGNCIQIHGHLLSGRSLLCRGYQPG